MGLTRGRRDRVAITGIARCSCGVVEGTEGGTRAMITLEDLQFIFCVIGTGLFVLVLGIFWVAWENREREPDTPLPHSGHYKITKQELDLIMGDEDQ